MKQLLILIMLTVSTTAFGQTIEQQIATFESPKQYQYKYDKFKDYTSVLTAPQNLKPIDKKKGVEYGLAAFYAMGFSGSETDKKGSPEFQLGIASYSSDWRFLRATKLILLIDGERLDLGNGRRSSSVGRGSVTEYLTYTLSADDLDRIGKSSTVELQVGNFEGRLSDESLRIAKNIRTLAP
jgi:hypothetical protein